MNVNQRSNVGPQAVLPHWRLEHPRLRLRRVEVRRRAGRRRLRLVAAGLAAVALVGAIWAVARSPLLDVDRITVVGVQRSVPAAVVATSGIQRGQALGDVEEETAARRIEQLPWVRDAVVRRQWPGRVSITVTERTEAAVTRAFGNQWALVDGTGRVLAWVPEKPAHLPLLAGGSPAGFPATTVDPATSGLLRVARAVPPALLPRLAAITARGSEVELDLVPHGVVRLGPPPGAAEKVTAVQAILARVDPGTVAAIDARFPSTAVLTRR